MSAAASSRRPSAACRRPSQGAPGLRFDRLDVGLGVLLRLGRHLFGPGFSPPAGLGQPLPALPLRIGGDPLGLLRPLGSAPAGLLFGFGHPLDCF